MVAGVSPLTPALSPNGGEGELSSAKDLSHDPAESITLE